MVMLDVLHRVSQEHGWRLAIAHLNHKLRGRGSDADERLVRRMGEKLGLPVIFERVEVREFARAQGISVEMAARNVRHEFLARTAARLKLRSVALAHHADDQIELFFLRLLRGSGTEGLAGMKWRNPSPSNRRIELVRPLLDQPKSALRAYAAERKIHFREDASNALLDIERNRIRHELLPLLRKSYQPALDRIVLRLMEMMEAEAEWVTEAAEEWLGKGPRDYKTTGLRDRKPTRPGDHVRQQRPPFDKLPVAVQRRCVQLQLLRQGAVPNFDLVEQLRGNVGKLINIGRVASSALRPSGNALERGLQAAEFVVHALACSRQSKTKLPGPTDQVQAVRDLTGIVTVRTLKRPVFRTDLLELDLRDRRGKVSFGGAEIGWRITRKPRTTESCAPTQVVGREVFDADRVGGRVLLRHWQPGDRFQPIGMRSAVKLQDFFANRKVPRERRHELIVGVSESGEVFWVEGMRIGERVKVTKETIRCLHWQWQRRNELVA